jgi:hypothetical protein
MATNVKNHPLAQVLKGLAEGNPQTTEQVLEFHDMRVDKTGLDAGTFDLVRLATLVAVDAPPASWLANMTVSQRDQVTLEQVKGTLQAIAPIVGTAKLTAAAGNIARAFGIAYDVDQAREFAHH